tara:strand:+ start:105 stop:668 length:564 start_codon:yes stop_codon:yes gene_type:complete
MSSQSTPISDLPKTDNQSNDAQESMMVNSILQDIENDDEINDVNEDSLKYTIDTSQIPPKIGNEMPSIETIKQTTETIFNEFPSGEKLMEPPNPNELDDFLNKKLETVEENTNDTVKESGILNKIQSALPLLSIVMILFFLLSLPALNNLIIKFVPKLSTDGEISILGIIFKSIIMGLIYLSGTLFL